MFIDGCGSYQAAKAGGTRSGLRKVLAGPKRMVGVTSRLHQQSGRERNRLFYKGECSPRKARVLGHSRNHSSAAVALR